MLHYAQAVMTPGHEVVRGTPTVYNFRVRDSLPLPPAAAAGAGTVKTPDTPAAGAAGESGLPQRRQAGAARRQLKF